VQHDVDVGVPFDACSSLSDNTLDGLETHAGAHLIGQFFSPETNLRTDKYGGSIENRARFALMVHEEIRKQVGDALVVGMRLSIEEGRGGLSYQDALAICKILEREGAVDFFNCVMGRMDTEIALAEENMPGMTRPLAPFLNRIGTFRQQVGLPVFHAARITDVATARYAIRDGLLDMVAMTRAHFADPNIANKIQAGNEDRIQPCIGASHCMYIKPHCIHNPATGRETYLPQVIEPSALADQKIVVIGGGPAGLEAARVCAERGHKVVLFEAASRLGGQVLLAAKASWRQDLIAIIDWRIAELEHLGIEVRLNTYAVSEDVMKENPDVVFAATGGIPHEFEFEGGALCNSVWEVLSGEVQAKNSVLVVDQIGRHQAVSCADHLAGLGSKVTLATIDDRIAVEMGYAERVVSRKRLFEMGVEMLCDVKIKSVHRSGKMFAAHLVNELTGKTTSRTADQIIVETGTQPVDEIFHVLRKSSLNDGVTDLENLLAGKSQLSDGQQGYILHLIGDAVTSRSIHAAILDAYRIAVRI